MSDRSKAVPMGDLVGHVYDPALGLFLLSTSSGYLRGWNPNSGLLVSETYIGGHLSGIDITPDGSTAEIGQRDAKPVNVVPNDPFGSTYDDVIYRVNLANLSVSAQHIQVTDGERGISDIAIAANNLGFSTTEFAGSGFVPLRIFSAGVFSNPLNATNYVDGSLNQVTQSTFLTPSESRRYILITQGNISNGPIAVYDSVANRLSATTDLYSHGFMGYNEGLQDISDAAGLIINITYNSIVLFNLTLGVVKDLTSVLGSDSVDGGHFLRGGHQVALWDSTKHSLVVYDTTSFAKVGVVGLLSEGDVSSRSIFGPNVTGSMEVTPDGQLLFLQTSNGFELVDLTQRLKLDVKGTAGADVLYGNVGDDTFTGGGGNDVFNGDRGVDTVVYTGSAASYSVNANPDGSFTVIDNRAGSPDGTSILKDIERIRFSDRTLTINVDLPASEQDAIRSVLRVDPLAPSADGFVRLIEYMPAGQALGTVIGAAASTTSVATLAYEFFTGKTPTTSGIDYLVSPTGSNPNNLNSAYYQSFNIENRYINFAVNLGKLGEGAASFQSAYGSLSFYDAFKKAYGVIFGATPTDAHIHAILDPTLTLNGQSITRQQYFADYGGDGLNGIGTKAAAVGWLMSEAEKADLGTYAKSNDAFLTDVANGTQSFGVDLIGVYARPEYAYHA